MIICKTKKWGNSLGIIIPSNLVREIGLMPEDEIVINSIEKKSSVLKEMFGFSKRKSSTKQVKTIINQTRKELGVD